MNSANEALRDGAAADGAQQLARIREGLDGETFDTQASAEAELGAVAEVLQRDKDCSADRLFGLYEHVQSVGRKYV